MLETIFIYLHTLSKIIRFQTLHKFHSTVAQTKILTVRTPSDLTSSPSISSVGSDFKVHP